MHLEYFNKEIGIRNTPVIDFIDVRDGHTEGEVCEADGMAVAKLVSMLVNGYSIDVSTISILTPYRAQRYHLENVLQDVPVGHIATVDEFQGLQNNVIIVSMVHRGMRPSAFLCDPRRVNVVTSRAKHAIYFVGRRATFEADGEQWGRSPLCSQAVSGKPRGNHS